MYIKRFIFVISVLAFSLMGCKAKENESDMNNTPYDYCGNNFIDENSEICDGTDTGGVLCTDIYGFVGGVLGCNDNCKAFDTSGCIPVLTADSALFNHYFISTVHITMNQLAIDSIYAESDRYVHADVTFTMDGTEIAFLDSGLRLKGRYGSFRQLDGKSAFLLNLDKFVDGQRLFGLEKLALNNMVQDPSMIHEQLGYKLFRAMNVPAPRTGYAKVYVNDTLYGLYTVVESTDNNPFLDQWFGDNDGNLYEGEYGGDLFDGLVTSFDQDKGDDVGFSDIQELTDLLDSITNPDDFMEVISQAVDMNSYLRFAATEIFLGHWDGYAWTRNNYFIYRRPSDSRWVWIPWGIDQIFQDYLYSWGGNGRMQQMCMNSIPCRTALGTAYTQLIQTINNINLISDIDALENLISDAADEDPRKEYSIFDMHNAVQGVRDFLASRPSDIESHFDCMDPSNTDEDGDGVFGCGIDCNDNDDTIYPGAEELCNGRDDNCDGLIDNNPACPYCFEQPAPDGGSLLFCFVYATYEEAEDDCLSQSGHLVSIHNQEMQNAVVNGAFAISSDSNWWIGTDDITNEGTFTWTDGTPMDFSSWAPGEPNNYDGNEDCGHIAPWAGGQWNDIPCSLYMYYICHTP
ncbi:CotH kinase family protein [Myxococcota bacterium]|nr:CotH kinase family protein [Myxococcota bacterium]MBU1382686.1 CotH kinase family protein [Myxococcota bacterium]MBU1497709.1 CotH kinase family protein [Myxococcota bacterium]